MKIRSLALVLALLGASAVQAANVTYTFTGTAYGGPTGDGIFKLSHTLDHFLSSGEEASFTLADIVTDPWGAGGTQAISQCASADAGNFGAIGSFVTFGGLCFWNDATQRDVATNQIQALSDDIQVTQNTAGRWSNSNRDLFLDVTVATDTSHTSVPEPATLPLVGIAALGLAGLRRRQRGNR